MNTREKKLCLKFACTTLFLGGILTTTQPRVFGENLLPNHSFEEVTDNRPLGWRIFTTPQEKVFEGDFFITYGTENEDVVTGAHAITFHFPDGVDIAQAVWTGDHRNAGFDVETGSYNCSFWIKADNLQERQHTWLSIVGFSVDGNRIGEIARSEYLTERNLPLAQWQEITFSFNIEPDSGVMKIAPSVVFKTHPDATVNYVAPETRVTVDDISITKLRE